VTPAIPQAFDYPAARYGTRHARLRNRVLRLTGFDLFPSDEVASAFKAGLTRGDPIAERFVAETYHGDLGAPGARALVERALRDGIEAVPEAPESLVDLIADFQDVPDWVDVDLVEQGAAVWRRWAYALGAVGNAGTMDTYTEGWLALPLRAGSAARAISLHVRIMHVSVRARVREHPEWDFPRWGLPISQSAMLLTLLGGSVAPALGLTALGFLTSPQETRAVLHFNRYCGHLVGVRCDGYFPRNAADAWRILFMADAARSYDSGETGAELVESFAPAFAPRPDQHGAERLRAVYHYRLQAGFAGLFMLPRNRRRYRLPAPWPGVVLLLLRSPLVAAVEIARRIVPGLDKAWQGFGLRRWERWHRWQSGGRAAHFQAATPLRR